MIDYYTASKLSDIANTLGIDLEREIPSIVPFLEIKPFNLLTSKEKNATPSQESVSEKTDPIRDMVELLKDSSLLESDF